jgi:hypothetical protein
VGYDVSKAAVSQRDVKCVHSPAVLSVVAARKSLANVSKPRGKIVGKYWNLIVPVDTRNNQPRSKFYGTHI